MQIKRNASRKRGLETQPRQRCSSPQDANTQISVRGTPWKWWQAPDLLVFKGRTGPGGRPPLSLRAQPCEVSQLLTIIKTPVLNNLLQDKVVLDLWNDSFLNEAALLIASLRQQENTEEKQVRNVLKLFLTCVARHDTSALKLFFSCNASENQPRFKWH